MTRPSATSATSAPRAMPAPVTAASLQADLARLGLRPGMVVMVHSSLSSLGRVDGGPQAVIDALLAAIGPDGTLMMPTHSSYLTDPAGWRTPPPHDQLDRRRAAMQPYDPARTETREMGAIVECFRRLAGVSRSEHPTVSAAAIGPRAKTLIDGHRLDRDLGEGSPQARLYDLDGHILLLGVGHTNNTSLHLAEHRSVPHDHPMLAQRSVVMVAGERRWLAHDAIDEHNDFAAIGAAFAESGRQRSGSVGSATAHLMRARELVDAATEWLRLNVYPDA